MELENFISKTISDIVQGLEKASKETKKGIELSSTGNANRRHIEFDVAVAAQQAKGEKGDAGGQVRVLEIFQAGAKLEKSKETMNSSVSRIKFGVRVK